MLKLILLYVYEHILNTLNVTVSYQRLSISERKNMDNVGQLFFVLKQNLQFMTLV